MRTALLHHAHRTAFAGQFHTIGAIAPAAVPPRRARLPALGVAVLQMTLAGRVGRCISRGALPKRAQRPPQVHTDAFQTPRQIALTSIAVVRSPYKERFGCPRQPSVTKGVLGAKAADCTLEFLPENIGSQEKIRFALQDLEGDQLPPHERRMVCPSDATQRTAPQARALRHPRTSPAESPWHVRLPLATSVDRWGAELHSLVSVDIANLRVLVHGLDLLDGTPVVDVKPYVPYCDSFPGARAGWLDEIEDQAEADHLSYWPPPKHLSPDAVDREAADGEEKVLQEG
ncbi:unnamed protein product [Durusdinium trenchii]|uniref:TsaA-like domain-containing protein n=1 Tax=Durusdinium trenchii TaxID=1381693 RepID=A0ABP0R0N2_9DINO